MTTTTVNGSALETIREVVQSADAGKVFGAPIHEDGLTVLPVAKVSGGGGGGGGVQPPQREGAPEETAGGSGGGVGLAARPLGVFVIKDGKVSWRPAVDVNKVILGGQLVAITALLVARAAIKARSAAGK